MLSTESHFSAALNDYIYSISKVQRKDNLARKEKIITPLDNFSGLFEWRVRTAIANLHQDELLLRLNYMCYFVVTLLTAILYRQQHVDPTNLPTDFD